MKKQCLFVLATSLLLAANAPISGVTKQETDDLQGTWAVISAERDGIKLTDGQIKAAKLQIVFLKDKLIQKQDGKTVNEATFRLNSNAKPKTIDTTDKKGTLELGIYMLKEDRLTICTAVKAGTKRPQDFATKAESGQMLIELRREKQ